MDTFVGASGLGSLGKKQRKERTFLLVSPKVVYLVMLLTLNMFKCLKKTDRYAHRTNATSESWPTFFFIIANVICNRP